jgi:hypothetical protein
MAAALPCQHRSTPGGSNIDIEPNTTNHIAYHKIKNLFTISMTNYITEITTIIHRK